METSAYITIQIIFFIHAFCKYLIVERNKRMKKEEKKLTYSQWCQIRRREIKYNIGLGAAIIIPPVLILLHYIFIGY